MLWGKIYRNYIIMSEKRERGGEFFPHTFLTIFIGEKRGGARYIFKLFCMIYEHTLLGTILS